MLNYSVSGDGFPVVFIHGFLESNTMWSEILPNFPNHKKIAVELLGHGNSPDPNQDLSLEHLADEVTKVLNHEKIEAFLLVGHSLGGYVALEIGKKWGKERCQHIVLLNSHPFEDSAIKKEERTQVARIVTKNKSLFIRQAIPNLFRAPEEHQTAVKHLIDEALNMSEESIALTTLAMRDRSSREEVMKDYATELTVIQGKHDTLIPFEKMQVITSEYKNNFFLLEEAGHMAHVEAYDEVVGCLMKVFGLQAAGCRCALVGGLRPLQVAGFRCALVGGLRPLQAAGFRCALLQGCYLPRAKARRDLSLRSCCRLALRFFCRL